MRDTPNLRFLIIAVVALLVFRLTLAATLPLLDKTEARYSEIARIMEETKDWVVLQVDYGVPFWAKPPLSIWLTALSFNTFGINELTARLPAFLLAICTILVCGLTLKVGSIYLLAFVLMTIPQFLLHAGVVSTDASFGFCIVMIMVSFWLRVTGEGKKFWGFLFFVFVGLGLIAKGPLVIALTGPPILTWCLLQYGGLGTVFKQFPWKAGMLVIVLMALPWYFLMEQRSPGFLNYFILGEHFNRFLESGWNGDRYGTPKSQPIGMIWIFLLVFAFPWIQIVFFWLWRIRKKIHKDRWVLYLVLWLLWTPLFFTLSKNIMHTYIVPVMAPIALLVVRAWEEITFKKLAVGTSLAFPAIAWIVFVFFYSTGRLDYHLNTDKNFLTGQSFDESKKRYPVYYWKQKTYSGQFYSKGRARVVDDSTVLRSLIASSSGLYLLILKRDIKGISKECMDKSTLVTHSFNRAMYLFEQRSPMSFGSNNPSGN